MKQSRLKKGFQAALLFIFIFSIFLNVFLYSQLRKYYTLLYAVELDPLGLSVFQNTEQINSDANAQTVVFYGDSRAAQWTNPNIEGFTFINRGIGNQTTIQILHRFETHIAPLQPDIIILQAGVNDLKTIPLFSGRKQEIISNCKEHIQQIINKSLQLNSVVIVSTIFPTGNVPLQRRLVWSDDIPRAILEVNGYIRSLSTHKVIVFDVAKLLSDENGKMKQEYGYDELHLNQAGYDVLNVELAKLLESIKKNSQ